MCGYRRRRYDDGARHAALDPIKAGMGRDSLARRLAMSRRTAEQWILLYRSNGEEAVMGGNGRKRLRLGDGGRGRFEGGMSRTETMTKYGVASVAALER